VAYSKEHVFIDEQALSRVFSESMRLVSNECKSDFEFALFDKSATSMMREKLPRETLDQFITRLRVYYKSKTEAA
jgi:hypothetical protein